MYISEGELVNDSHDTSHVFLETPPYTGGTRRLLRRAGEGERSPYELYSWGSL